MVQLHCVVQLQTCWSSVSASSSHQRQANRLSCKQRNDASRTNASLSTDARSLPASRTNAGSLPTCSGSLPTSRTDGRSVPSREIVHHDVSTKKMKVEVDDIEFESDFDTEMMMMMAQTTEMQNSSHSSSSRVAGNWTGARDGSATSAALMSKTVDGSRRDLTETGSRTASDSAISYASMRRDIAGSRQSDNTDRQGFIDRDLVRVKDEDIMDVKHYSVTSHNSSDGDARYHLSLIHI